MTGLLKVGPSCIDVPMFSELSLLRAGHGRRGEPLQELAGALRRDQPGVCAIVLGAGVGERLADLSANGMRSALCIEAAAEPFALLERNASRLGGTAFRALVGGNESRPQGSDSPVYELDRLLARFPSFQQARLLLLEGTQGGPTALAGALAWIGARRPLLALEISLTDSESLDRWSRALTALAALDYRSMLVFDPLDHPLGCLASEGGQDLLAALWSARCHGGGLRSATVLAATRPDHHLLTQVSAAVAARNSPSAAHRIAVVRLDNLGDHVLGAGIFSALRARYPHSKLVAVVPAGLGELYARCPTLDALLTVPSFHSYLPNRDLMAQVARYLSSCSRFDLVINPRYAEDWYAAGFFGSCLAAPGARRLGFRQVSDPLPNYQANSYYNDLLDAPDTLHTARYTGIMAGAATGSASAGTPEVWFAPQDWDAVARRWDLEPQRYFVVGVGTSFMNKRPSLRIYRLVLTRLLAESQPVVLVGSAAESIFAAELRAGITDGSRIIAATGVMPLYELAALLKHARLYIGPDAGPKHMAAAARTPVLELSWVPADFAAVSRSASTAGRCWAPWNTLSRSVYPTREAFDRALSDSAFREKPSADVDSQSLDLALQELLSLPSQAAVGA